MCLPSLDDPDFMFRGNPRVNRVLGDLILQLLITKFIQLLTGNRASFITRLNDSQTFSDCPRRYLMITGNHQ